MNTPTTAPASNDVPPVRANLAMDWLEEEHEKLLSMAIALEHELQPADPRNAEEHENLTAWRLSQLLCERLSDTRFTEGLRELLQRQ